LGRESPVAQGRRRVEMEKVFVGIDISKDRLDVHVLPKDDAFAVPRNGQGLAELVVRLQGFAPPLVAVEARGVETTVAAALAGAGLPLAVVNPARECQLFCGAPGDWQGVGGANPLR
jgi:transposase